MNERERAKLLKTKRFRSANRPVTIADQDLPTLGAFRGWLKAKAHENKGKDKDDATQMELVAYSRTGATVRVGGTEHCGTV